METKDETLLECAIQCQKWYDMYYLYFNEKPCEKKLIQMNTN